MNNDNLQQDKDQPFNAVDLSVIIVNYNTSDLLSKCLLSIEKQVGVTFEVFVVDNASKDQSVKMLKSRFKWVKIIANKFNAGFSKANNQAISLAKGRDLFFLNPDTTLHPGSFAAIKFYFERCAHIGLAGLTTVNPDGSPQSSVEYRYPGQRHAKKELNGLPGEIAWLLGAGIVARNRVIHAIKGFDERYFLYGEDIDLCLSARKAGWQIGQIPDAIMTHWGGESERESLPVAVWQKKFFAEVVFYRKHYSEKALRAICRANIRQAYWRILTLSITPWSLRKQTNQAKLEKYRLASTFFRRVLQGQADLSV